MALQALEHLLLNTHGILKNQIDLSPHNHVVNQTLGGFVTQLMDLRQHNYGAVLETLMQENAHFKELPAMCGQAEGLMEKYWATKLLAEPTLNWETMQTFWYYENYVKLWESEWPLVQQTQGRLVFLGGGALPFTAWLAALSAPNRPIVCVDYDTEACALAQNLTHRLNLNSQITIWPGRAEDFAFEATDTVMCASLLDNRLPLYRLLHRAGVQNMLVRDAEDVYMFLYNPAEKPTAMEFEFYAQSQPSPACINTTLLYKRTEA